MLMDGCLCSEYMLGVMQNGAPSAVDEKDGIGHREREGVNQSTIDLHPNEVGIATCLYSKLLISKEKGRFDGQCQVISNHPSSAAATAISTFNFYDEEAREAKRIKLPLLFLLSGMKALARIPPGVGQVWKLS